MKKSFLERNSISILLLMFALSQIITHTISLIESHSRSEIQIPLYTILSDSVNTTVAGDGDKVIVIKHLYLK